MASGREQRQRRTFYWQPRRLPSRVAAYLRTVRCRHRLRLSAQWAIGEAKSDALLERARVAAGAGSARFLRPNEPVTLEYVGSRLNLGLDLRDLVRTVVCG